MAAAEAVEGPTTHHLVRLPRAARRAVLTVFACNGAGLSTWFPHIPEIQRKLDLSDGALGLALLGTPIGALVAMPLSSFLIRRFGSRRVTLTAAMILFVSLPLPALAPDLALLVAALALLGAGNGVLDVAMNVQAVAVEQGYQRPIMSTFHGVFSVGGLTGALVAVAVTSLGVEAAPHLAVMAVILAVTVLRVSPHLLADIPSEQTEARESHGVFTWPSRALVRLGLVAFCVLVGEGAMADWSAVYLRNTLETGAGFASAGFAVFSSMMALGRLTGDKMTARLGPVAMLRYGGIIVAVGLGLALASASPVAALVGFACVGLGLAAGFPIAISAAGRVPGVPSGSALTAVTTVGYAGFLAGPPIIGLLSELSSLRLALGVVALLGAVIIMLASAVAVRDNDTVTPWSEPFQETPEMSQQTDHITARWDGRYGGDEYAFGEEPNEFLVAHAGDIPEGPVLCLGEGEGRNAVFLAGRGHAVTGVDLSPVGLSKAAALAARRDVQIETVVADLDVYPIEPSAWSGIVSIFAHLPSAVRRGLHRRVVDGLAPGGVFLLEHYNPGQIGRGTGGPSDVDMLPTVAILRDELDGLVFEHAEELVREVVEGPYHTGIASVVQLIARKPG